MRISDLLNPASVSPRAQEGKQKEANVQPRNLQSNARLDTLGDREGRITKRKKSADSTQSTIKQMSGRFALKSSSQAGATASSNRNAGDPALLVLDFTPERPRSKTEELISILRQRSSDPQVAKKYVAQLRHFAKWAAEDPIREKLDDVINSELTPKHQPVIQAWRNDPHNAYAREGYAAFNALRAVHGKTVDPPRKAPPKPYDTVVNLNDS